MTDRGTIWRHAGLWILPLLAYGLLWPHTSHLVSSPAGDPTWEVWPSASPSVASEPERQSPLPRPLDGRSLPIEDEAWPPRSAVLARAFLACRRGADDVPRSPPVLHRRLGGADGPDSPTR